MLLAHPRFSYALGMIYCIPPASLSHTKKHFASPSIMPRTSGLSMSSSEEDDVEYLYSKKPPATTTPSRRLLSSSPLNESDDEDVSDDDEDDNDTGHLKKFQDSSYDSSDTEKLMDVIKNGNFAREIVAKKYTPRVPSPNTTDLATFPPATVPSTIAIAKREGHVLHQSTDSPATDQMTEISRDFPTPLATGFPPSKATAKWWRNFESVQSLVKRAVSGHPSPVHPQLKSWIDRQKETAKKFQVFVKENGGHDEADDMWDQHVLPKLPHKASENMRQYLIPMLSEVATYLFPSQTSSKKKLPKKYSSSRAKFPRPYSPVHSTSSWRTIKRYVENDVSLKSKCKIDGNQHLLHQFAIFAHTKMTNGYNSNNRGDFEAGRNWCRIAGDIVNLKVVIMSVNDACRYLNVPPKGVLYDAFLHYFSYAEFPNQAKSYGELLDPNFPGNHR